MDHPVVTNVDAHMGNAGSVIGALEEHQISRLCIGRGNRGADVAQSLGAESADTPSGMIDDPAYKTGTVEGSGRTAAAPDVFSGFGSLR